MNDLILQQESNTMSSTQLAVMLGYDKKEINRKVKQMFADKIDGGIISPSLDARNYVTDYHLPELESKMFVAKHDIEYLEVITKYWINKEAPALPSPTQLALMVIESEKQKEIAQEEVARLQGVCNTITAQFAPGVTAATFTRQLNGVNTQQVNKCLIDMGVLLRRSGGLVPSSYYRDRYFIERQEVHNDKPRYHAELTLVGAKWLYRAYLSNKLPMKKTWDNNFVHIVFTGE
jgi:hypothetical protein